MPEGPEIRTVCDKLRVPLVGKIITGFWLGERAKATGFQHLKCPASIISIRSYGKKAVVSLSIGCTIVVSFGMEGRLQYVAGNHSHIRFDLSSSEINGSFRVLKPAFSLFFDDTRYMGGVDIIPNTDLNTYFNTMGPDLLEAALTTWISLDQWIHIFMAKKTRRQIVDLLLDQKFVTGIGMYLVTEILYFAKIHPERRANTLTREEWDIIRMFSHKVILSSYQCGGCTIKSFISPDGVSGGYIPTIYGRKTDPSNYPIIDKPWRGRHIHFVAEVQK